MLSVKALVHRVPLRRRLWLRGPFFVFKFYSGSPILPSSPFDCVPLAKLAEARYLPSDLLCFQSDFVT